VLIGSCELDFAYELECHVPFLKNLLNNALAFGNFSLGHHQQALELYELITPNEPSTDMTAASYNISVCEGILAFNRGNREGSLAIFEKAASFILRPEPFFYMAVIMNSEYLKEPINTDGFVIILELIERGLRTG
jgi:tetratricopeptide (TPR) repeat protein